MVIISRNDTQKKLLLRSVQFRYAIIYVIVTFAVLLFLNIYCSKISQQLFYSSKKAAMIEICHLTANKIAALDVISETTVESTVQGLITDKDGRIIVTDASSIVIYDSASGTSISDKYVLYPEIVTAISGNDVFRWQYHAGTMRSFAATPIYSSEKVLGCIYITEYDSQEGALIASIQSNILMITLFLEIIVIIFSFASSHTYTIRLKKIMASMRTVRDGDYSHKLQLRGHDELNLLSSEFNDLISRLQISENKRSQFVSDASHELKTPLASIKLLSDSILQNNMDPETIREFVGDIGNEAERLNKMSQKLLSLSRIDGASDSEAEIIYICPTVSRVVRMLSAFAAESGVAVEEKIIQDSTILIPEDDLYQILFNLIENGIKYNKRGGKLTITVEKSDDDALITIADTGMGIPEQSIDHVFERFYRVDKARSRSTGGSGLGLSIVRNLIKRNSGSIHVASEVGQGTTFTVRFPHFDTEEAQHEAN